MINKQDWSTYKRLLFMQGSGGSVVEATATGNPLSFTTDVAKPLKSLTIPWTPIQSGTGDPSPSNVRPITGVSALTVYQSGADTSDPATYSVTFPALGKNLLDPETLQKGGINSDGMAVSNPKRVRTGFIPVKENTRYTISAGSGYKAFMHFYDANKDSIGTNTDYSAISPSGAFFVRGIIGYESEEIITPSDVTTGQLEEGSATSYEPYTNTVYGGSLDLVSGVLTVTHKIYEFNKVAGKQGQWDSEMGKGAYWYWSGVANLDTLNDGVLCDKFPIKSTVSMEETNNAFVWYANGIIRWVDLENMELTKQEYATYLASHPFHATYKRKTPQTIQLTPQQITALVGDNVIWSDTNGSNTAVYFKKG